MVAWVPDRSGRFPKRPHYTQQELDRECEAIVGRFLREKYGKVEYPLTTNDLTILVESFCSDVDQYADLSAEGADVEGMTEFFPDIAPKIYISERIATDERRENRLRRRCRTSSATPTSTGFSSPSCSRPAPCSPADPPRPRWCASGTTCWARRRWTGWSGRRAMPAAPS